MIRKPFVFLLVVLFLVGLTAIDFGHVLSDSTNSQPQTLVFGKVFLSGGGICYICPTYLTQFDLQDEYIVPTNAPGIRVELPHDADRPQDGDSAVCVGVLNSNTWCISSSEFIAGDIKWLTGEIEGDTFTLVGKDYRLFFDARFVNLSAEGSQSNTEKRVVDLFGARDGETVFAYAVCDALPSKKTYVGKLVEFDGRLAKIETTDGEGRRTRTRTITAIIDKNTHVFEGKNPIDATRIIPGRICVLYGHYDTASEMVEASTIICDLDLATDGGRVIGVIEKNNADRLVVKTSLPHGPPLNLDVKTNINTKVIKGDSVIDEDEIASIPVGTNLEVIGYFGVANPTIQATTIIVTPRKPSDSVFGKLSEDGLIDYFGKTHDFDFDDLSNVTGSGGQVESGRWVLAWISDGHVQSAYLPELGFMGVRISGYLMSVGNTSIELDCVSSMDYDLPGRVLDIGCGAYCKAIIGGIGVVRLSDIPLGSFLHCWGVPTLDGGFAAMLVNVQTIIE